MLNKLFLLTKYKQKDILKNRRGENIMLGVCLLFVGIVLINNGMCSLYNVDGKSTAIMNIFTGGLSLFINFVNLVQGNYYAAGTGLLFCFTYLFVALSKFLKASPIPFAWFSTFVAINAVIFGTIEVPFSQSPSIPPIRGRNKKNTLINYQFLFT